MKPEQAAMAENQHKSRMVAWMLLKNKLWAENPGVGFSQNPMQQRRNGKCTTRKGKSSGGYVYYVRISVSPNSISRRENWENKAQHTLKAVVEENFQELTKETSVQTENHTKKTKDKKKTLSTSREGNQDYLQRSED